MKDEAFRTRSLARDGTLQVSNHCTDFAAIALTPAVSKAIVVISGLTSQHIERVLSRLENFGHSVSNLGQCGPKAIGEDLGASAIRCRSSGSRTTSLASRWEVNSPRNLVKHVVVGTKPADRITVLGQVRK